MIVQRHQCGRECFAACRGNIRQGATWVPLPQGNRALAAHGQWLMCARQVWPIAEGQLCVGVWGSRRPAGGADLPTAASKLRDAIENR